MAVFIVSTGAIQKKRNKKLLIMQKKSDIWGGINVRPIKVRGYAVEEYTNGQWRYGTGVHVTDFTEEYAKETGRKEECFIFTESGWVEVIRESVGQYTGLKDNNGREIYEGDVINYLNLTNNHRKLVVEWSEWDSMFNFGGIRVDYATRSGEVIGNIYEDKHLLEGGHE